MPEVSIIVIGSNVREEVLACLQSVQDHAGELKVETIVVDNASRDGTVAAVKGRFPETRVVALSSNEGGAARNHGLRLAGGRLRMFLDSDAVLTSGALQELVRFIDSHPTVGLVGPRLVYPEGGPQFSARRFPPPFLPLIRRPPLDRFFEGRGIVRRHLMMDQPQDRSREVEYVIGACQLFTAEAQIRAGELDPRIFHGPEDLDWCMQIRATGLKIAYHPKATVVHGYRRTTARRPRPSGLIGTSNEGPTPWSHLRDFAYVQWKWRRQRPDLIRESAAIEARGGRLSPH